MVATNMLKNTERESREKTALQTRTYDYRDLSFLPFLGECQNKRQLFTTLR